MLIYLNLNILDVNDHTPVFNSQYVEMNISESREVGSLLIVGEFLVEDGDCGELSWELNTPM